MWLIGRIKLDVMFRRVCNVVVPSGHQITTVFGRVHQNVAPGSKSAIYDCLVELRFHVPFDIKYRSF